MRHSLLNAILGTLVIGAAACGQSDERVRNEDMTPASVPVNVSGANLTFDCDPTAAANYTVTAECKLADPQGIAISTAVEFKSAKITNGTTTTELTFTTKDDATAKQILVISNLNLLTVVSADTLSVAVLVNGEQFEKTVSLSALRAKLTSTGGI